jgi:hypothetical protein
MLRPLFRYAGWKRLGARGLKANRYADKLAETMADYEMAEVMKGIIRGFADRSLDTLMADVLKDHPSHVVLQLRFDRILATQPAALQPLAASVAPMAPAVAVAVAEDPVVRTVVQQNYYHDTSERWSNPSDQPTAARGDDHTAAPATDQTVKSAWEIELHERLKYVGDGKTYQIGPLANYSTNFDGRRSPP